jgi:hypothetical protein
MMPTTPIGSRVTSTSTPGRTDAPAHRAPQHFAGEELENVAGAGHFADPFRQRLAFFAREQLAELVLARDDLVADLVEHVRARLHVERGPRGDSGARGGNRLLGLCGVGLRVFADDVAQVGRIDVLGPGRARYPLPLI